MTFFLRDVRKPVIVGKLPAAALRRAIAQEGSRFALVHRLAAVVRHQRQGCPLCKENPAFCPIGKIGVSQQEG